MNDAEEEVDVAHEEQVHEFDDGTEIWIMTDDTLRLKLPCMPPSWNHRLGAFDSFEQTLSHALGTSVEGLDKEFFGIHKPQPDTVVRLRAFLIDFRQRNELA
ncbi:MAG: hypothetical protein P9F19_19035 [Candidatus Contendobacter sp.]|nr:hypothetical protein [Candidatus Contendobacter sp.]MDG4559465.1 hypothetical protein [Candidatus Contendobacter sp.]